MQPCVQCVRWAACWTHLYAFSLCHCVTRMEGPFRIASCVQASRLWCIAAVFVTLLVAEAVSVNVHWCPKVCACYNHYTTVDCANKGLSRLPPMSNLTQYLFLDGNDISGLAPRAFHQTPNLLKLHIQHSKLRQIESASFCGLDKLQELHLGHNQLTAFHVGGSEHCKLPDLKELVLSGNKLKEIPRNLSSFVPNLEILNIHNNELQSAAVDESFGQLHSLGNLDVSLNRIHEIEKEDLDPIRNVVPLEILRMSDCGLVFVHPLAFVGLNNLTSLSMSRSLLSSLETIFRPFSAEDSRMTHLDISEMFLPTLTSAMLGMFKRLVLLDASFSGVNYTQPQLFNKLHNLETLHLEGNILRRLDNIMALRKLRRLYLSGNQLSTIELGNLTQLEVINLSHNKFTTIPAGWLLNSDNLLMLNLSGNHISTIDRHAFSKVTLNILDLSHNNLTTLGPVGTVALRKLDLSHNMIKTVSSEAFYFMASTLSDVDLSENKLAKLPLDIFEDFHSLQCLSLQHNDFGDNLQSGKLRDLFKGLGHLQELDFSYNNIHSLPSEQFSSLHHLTTLNLQGNHITDLALLSLQDLPSLAKLIISNNDLASIKTEVLSHLDLLEVLDLSSNPYECTCNIESFLSWLKTTRVMILDHKNHSKYCCSFPPAMSGQYIYSYNPGPDECPAPEPTPKHHHILEHQRWTILGIVLGCVLVTVGILGIVLYFGHVCQHIKSLHYRWQVRYREVSGVEIAGDPKA